MASYYVRSAATGTADGSSWANAYTTLGAATAARNVAGNYFFVSEDHNESSTTANLSIYLTGSEAAPSYVICVNHNGSVPPVGADMTTGAVIATTAAYTLTTSGTLGYFYGITFQCGSGANSPGFNVGCPGTYVNCSFQSLGTNSNGYAININSAITLVNTPVLFNNVGSGMRVSFPLIWKNTPNAVQGSIPTTLFATANQNAVFSNVDFSMYNTGKTVLSTILLANDGPFSIAKDCSIGTGGSLAATPACGQQSLIASRCDSAGTNYRESKISFGGTQSDELVIVRTGGASDGYTVKSRNITTNANNTWIYAFEAIPISVWNDTTNSITATIYGICFGRTALPTNDQIWLEVSYLGSSSNTLGSVVSSGKSDVLAPGGTSLTGSTQAWDSLAPSRTNSTAYTIGQTIKVASAPGQLFRCTANGTSAASPPSGYSSTADGASIVDGTATFQAAMRFQQTLTFTAGQKGMIYATVKVAQASTTFYIDPMLVLM